MFLIGKFVLVALLASSTFAMMPPSATKYYAESLVDPRAAFSKWAEDNGKTYTSDLEETYRYIVWRKTLDDVVAWNTDNQTAAGYAKGMTWFGDQTQEEFESQALCSFSSFNKTSLALLTNSIPLEAESRDGNRTATVPASVDWRAAGVVGSVKNQQYCGGCWAFGPVSAVESAFALLPPISGPPDLSEQELIDCAPGSPNDNGCEGNNEYNAYNTIGARGGISLEQDYPFISGLSAVDGECRPPAAESGRPFVTIDGFAYGDSLNEETILEWAAYQPVTVAVDASQWKDFQSGFIYDGPCSSDGSNLNHIVTIVGFGEENGVPYWLVKNSWGQTWGEDGYMRLRRGVGGAGRCGVNSELSFPLYCGWNTQCVDSEQIQPGTNTNGTATTAKRPIKAVFPPLQAGLPLPMGYNNNAEKKFNESGPVAVEFGEYESGILAAFVKEYGA